MGEAGKASVLMTRVKIKRNSKFNQQLRNLIFKLKSNKHFCLIIFKNENEATEVLEENCDSLKVPKKTPQTNIKFCYHRRSRHQKGKYCSHSMG